MEVDKRERGRGGRGRRSRILAVFVQLIFIFARPRWASLTIFGWDLRRCCRWSRARVRTRVRGYIRHHRLEPQNLKYPACCPAPTFFTSEPGVAATAAIISAEAIQHVRGSPHATSFRVSVVAHTIALSFQPWCPCFSRGVTTRAAHCAEIQR